MTHSKPNQGSETVGETTWEAFAECLETTRERRPTGKGWFERTEVMKRMNLRRSRFTEVMRNAVKAGSIERFDGMVQRDGALRNTTFYRRIK